VTSSSVTVNTSPTGPAAVLAPAKLNLGLHVTGRRADGYHLLESLFVPIDLADRIRLELGSIRPAGKSGAPDIQIEFDIEMKCEGALGSSAPLPVPEENLAVRAARQFLSRAGQSGALSIWLEKSIPIGAGLGGGSSDAGAILRALDRSCPGVHSRESLLTIAAELGADVPFFLAPEPSIVRGIGEQVSPLANLPTSWLLLANPGVSLATAEVFEKFDSQGAALTLAQSRSTMRSLEGLGDARRATESLSKAFDSGLLENDLEVAAADLCPAMSGLKERLRELGARWTGMSGSGATVYGVFADEDQARSALELAGFEAPIWARVAQTQGGSKS
jgi:4-diphosphocytidyl-2-C-methyl-D-erythritol kinase